VNCLQCGRWLGHEQTLPHPVRYCSPACASIQVETLGHLLNTTPRDALSVFEWHDLSAAYASDLALLERHQRASG
jgi:hypothetical protein